MTASEPILLNVAVFLLGLVAGSYLNLLALRTLGDDPIASGRSYCPKCTHLLTIAELIPLISFFLQKGRCKHCRAKLPWYYPVVELSTAVSFVVLVHRFGVTWQGLAMLVFVSTLIAVTVTDFREKIIPHEITYPSIMAGIIFSTASRKDFYGTLAGVGLSYVLFDLLAFYGLQFYLLSHKPVLSIGANRPSALQSEGFPPKKPSPAVRVGKTFFSRDRLLRPLKPISTGIRDRLQMMANGQPIHEIEVMGGGDAVLSALIAAWLGFPKLVCALLIGFLLGTLMGATYLLAELHKQRMLKTCIQPISIGAGSGATLFGGMIFLFSHVTQQSFFASSWLPSILLGSAGGAILGAVYMGSRVSKPFPFGPALAGGALAAIFINTPNKP